MSTSKKDRIETISSIKKIADRLEEWLQTNYVIYKRNDREPPLKQKYTPIFGPQLEELDKICDWLRGRELPYVNTHTVIREKILQVETILSEIDQLTLKYDYRSARGKIDSLVHHIWRLVETLRNTESALKENSQGNDGQGETDVDREIDSETKEVAWKDNDCEYLNLRQAVELAKNFNRKIAESTFSKKLTPKDAPLRYMRKYAKTGRPYSCKVHFKEFIEFINSLPKIKPTGTELSDESIEAYLNEKDSTQAAIKKQKEAKGKTRNQIEGPQRLLRDIEKNRTKPCDNFLQTF